MNFRQSSNVNVLSNKSDKLFVWISGLHEEVDANSSSYSCVTSFSPFLIKSESTLETFLFLVILLHSDYKNELR